MFPLAVCKKSRRMIIFHKLLEHGNEMLYGVFFGVFQIKRMIPLINGMINAEAHVSFIKRCFKLTAEIPVRAYVNAVPERSVLGFIKAVAVVML